MILIIAYNKTFICYYCKALGNYNGISFNAFRIVTFLNKRNIKSK